MSETPADRARRKARQERATGVYGTGASLRLDALRRFDQWREEEE